MTEWKFMKAAKELYGEMRDFTEEEREIYNRVTKENSVPLGINTFDILRGNDYERRISKRIFPKA